MGKQKLFADRQQNKKAVLAVSS
jgi:hypothetical protein